MTYVNCGARDFVTQDRFASKAALRRHLTAGLSVEFDPTSAFGPFDTIAVPADGVTLTVVGPDPYTSRKWYASVTHGPKGWKVS